MSEKNRDISFHQCFECYRIDSSVRGDLFPVAPRSHYFSEVLLVRSGTCLVTRGGISHDLKAGELLFISPLIRHSVDSADGGPVVIDVVKFSATRLREIPSYLSNLRALALDAAHAHLPVYMTAEETKTWHLDSIIEECISESRRQDFAWELHVRALIYLIITAMTRFWISKRKTFEAVVPPDPDPILDIPAYIEQHISEPLRVEELARRCELSYPWFAKRFRELFGLSCKQFIEHVRTETVEQYLIYTELDLSDISSRTGYTDCSHMVKDFRRMTGMTPGQYRSSMKIQGFAPFSRFSAPPAPIHPPKG